jgi:hypothetical protein
MDEQQPDIAAAETALAALAETRRRMAERAHWSFRRHLAVGLLVGMLVASYALPPVGTLVAVAIALVATLLLVRSDRRRDGFFVNGYRAGRTRQVALLFVAVAMLGLAAALVGKHVYGLTWVPLVAGAAVAVLGTIASLQWERVYRADLAERP